MISLGASAQPDYLLDSLLNPNARVKENYNTTVIATVDGRVVAGVQIQKSEKTLTLRTADNKIVEHLSTRVQKVDWFEAGRS